MYSERITAKRGRILNNEKNHIAYFYIKSPDLAFSSYKSEEVFSDTGSQQCEYCENTETYDY